MEFGPGGRFVGILTRDDSAGGNPAEVALLITNAGIIHRVGPHRLHVRLAREMAAIGVPCLRYDLPGIGDSDSVGGAQIAQMKLTATRASIDRLQRMGVAHRFVIMGICSGADHSLMASVVDPRITGAIVIDPTTVFETPRHRVNRTVQRASRLFVPRVLWRLVTGKYRVLDRLSGPKEAPIYGLPKAPDPEDVETRRQAAQALGTLATRGTRLYMIMTGHTRMVFSYRKQIVDAFPEVEGLPEVLRVNHLPSVGHTFASEADRAQLVAGITDFLMTIPPPAESLVAPLAAARA